MTVGVAYGLFSKALVQGKIDVEGDTLKCSLFDSTYVPDVDADEFLGDLTGELSGGGYAAVTLTNVVASYVSASNKTMVDCDNPTFSGLTSSTIRYAVFYRWSGSAATSELICYMDFETDRDAAGTWAIQLPATGLFDVAV